MSEHERAGVDWKDVYRRLEMVRAALEEGAQPNEREKKRILKDRATLLAREPSPEAEAGEFLDVVTFLLADETYGVESAFVREVYTLKYLTPVPCTPSFVLGITSVRGRIVPVIDILKFFGIARESLNEFDKIVIVASGGIEAGIRADAVSGVQSVPLEKLQAILPTLTENLEKYLRGVTPERLVILDTAALLSDPALIVNEEVAD
jgi:purine-binding chemotaxis protein CheW